jgi:hypothetical protein
MDSVIDAEMDARMESTLQAWMQDGAHPQTLRKYGENHKNANRIINALSTGI